MNRNWPFHQTRERALALAGTLMLLLLPPEGSGAPAGKAALTATNAYVTNGIARGSLPDFRLPTREDLQRQKHVPAGSGATENLRPGKSMPPPLNPAQREQLRQQIEAYYAQVERENPPVLRAPQVVERGPHHNQWETYRLATNETGRAEVRTNSYTELGTGLNRMEAGMLVPARAVVELHPQGAVGRQGAHRVIFGPNSNRAKAIEIETSDGKVLKSHVLGLFYFDMATGKSVRLSALKDSEGAVQPPNMVVYQDAFADLRADLRYTYKLHGLEQDVILREQPPAPQDVGLNDETSQLVVLTEFVDAPEPRRAAGVRVLKKRQFQGREVDTLTDETLEFGAMLMGPGKAFRLEQQGQAPNQAMEQVPVGKRWLQQGGRTFLIEAVEYSDLKAQLPQLPRRAQLLERRPLMELNDMLAGFISPDAAKPEGGRKMQVASLPLSGPGLVVDYDLVASATNFTFEAGKTYCVSNTVSLSGATIIEGGAVVKFDRGPRINILGTLELKTSDYSPAIFTAMDDNSAGETITGSTGSPTNSYAYSALEFPSATNDLTLKHLRIKHATQGVFSQWQGNVTVQDVQVLSCSSVGLHLDTSYTGELKIYNSLVGQNSYGIVSTATNAQFLHCTFDQNGSALWIYGTGTTRFTNNIFANGNVGNVPNVSATSNASYNSAAQYSPIYATALGASPFQSVGGGDYYLAASNGCQNAGSSSLNPELAALIARKTTEPPAIVSTGLVGNVVFSKRVARDTNTPDLGYHYAPLDYVFAATWLQDGAKVTVQAGTCIGVANPYTNYTYYGIYMNPYTNNSFRSITSPADPNRFVLFNAVQERGAAAWNQNVVSLLYAASYPFLGEAEFNEFVVPGSRTIGTIYGSSVSTPGAFSIRHSSFKGGNFHMGGVAMTVNSCLFERAKVDGVSSGTNTFHNCTFVGGSATFSTSFFGGGITVQDSLFDKGTLTSSGNLTHGYNGYVINYNRLSPTQATDVVVTDMGFQTGPLGGFYLSASNALLNAGSRLASAAGLYHFTTATNQTKETNSTVDLGYHYVAVNGSGQPLDTDGDGLPDYYEDSNGDGALQPGETSPTTAYTLLPSLHDSLVDFDYDGASALKEYQLGTDPLNAGDYVPAAGLLGRWRFDTSALMGDQGQVPRHTNNVSLASSWNTNAVLLSGSNTLTRLLNIDYGSSPDTNYYKWGMAAYGLTTNDYWYPYYNPWVTDVTVTNLSWSTGTGLAAGHSLRVQNAPGQWGSDTGDYMYNGYIYDWDSQGIANTYKGLPPGLYDLYLYGHGAASDQNTSFSVFTSTRDFGSKATLNTNTWSSTNWTEGVQLVTFTNVTLLTEQALQINALKVASAYTCINGMQLANRVASQLAYREVETNGVQNIYLKRGTAMFWVKPDWTSGTGPGHEGRLLEVGDQGSTNGWWALYCTTNGSQLKFAGKSGTNTSTYFTCAIGWSNVWIHVALTYTETNSVLYLNGTQATNGAGVTLVPDLVTRFMSGLNVGGDVTGWNNLRGQMDELEIYNYPLSASEISSTYNALASRDTDGDGLTDRFENQYGLNHLVWTDPNDDSDYDGRTLLQEQADNTDPRNGTSMAKVRLGYWRFDTDAFLGEQGQVPKSVYEVSNVLSWDGQALRSIDPSGYRRLAYRDVETNGNANINCRQGSVSFWFRPAWSSTNLGGTGPGGWGRLIELGQYADPATDGNWQVHLNPSGTQLFFYSQTNGTAAGYLWPAVSLTSNYWHHLVVTYGPSGTAVYLDGQLQQTGGGVTVWPGATVRANDGFSVGSDRYGGQRAVGDFEELETFNYPLSSADVLAIYNADFDGDGVPNYRDARPRDPTVTTFGVTIETPAAGSTIR